MISTRFTVESSERTVRDRFWKNVGVPARRLKEAAGRANIQGQIPGQGSADRGGGRKVKQESKHGTARCGEHGAHRDRVGVDRRGTWRGQSTSVKLVASAAKVTECVVRVERRPRCMLGVMALSFDFCRKGKRNR